ncbi:hypothetical protein LYSHEL_27080 [Lysobacter helvus]|uniref:Uncharacterized protein n=2 Tax=Lysobacteraceae TaxID=32033 RepID=A0ABM7Q8I7_9GAMM|nr:MULTISPECIES: hypothetical protein [Lysobacter]BCT93681.1 hypothetical protein LYSCAS_27050 [Lysobacter caseinilyticus]BCT96837.1 hypothetical protein LYSHEL_27080 [Lysobacter helvus]
MRPFDDTDAGLIACETGTLKQPIDTRKGGICIGWRNKIGRDFPTKLKPGQNGFDVEADDRKATCAHLTNEPAFRADSFPKPQDGHVFTPTIHESKPMQADSA